MLVKVLFFASARDATGGIKEIPEFEILPTQAEEAVTTKHLIAKLEELYPALNFERDQIAIAVNQAYVTGAETVLKQGDEVALLPPISGG
jgi:molybdopterin converting factor subunit 1